MDIEIKSYPYKSACDIRRCSARSELSIGVPGESPATNFNTCRDHLRQIVEKGAEVLGLSFMTDDIVKQLEAKDAEIEQLQKKLEESSGNAALQSEIDRLNIELEASATEINRLTVEMEILKQKAASNIDKAETDTAKGGKKK